LKSLLARLLLVVSIALVPALAFQAYTEIDARRIRQQLVEDEALRLVRLISSEQQRIAEGADQMLDAISSAPALQDNMSERCQRFLSNLLHRLPRYNYATVIGLDGHAVCAPGPFDPRTDFSDRLYFRLALQTGGFVIGESAVGRFSKQPSIHMAKPLTNQDGIVEGVVDVSLSLDWLGHQLEHLDLPPGAAVSIRDRNGTILARYPEGARFIGEPMSLMPSSALAT
jgi:C4-dicarboxylate-specific signal transduction histidine kinase